MPLFSYQALSSDGKALKGVVDADSLVAAKEKLRKQNILVTLLEVLHSKQDVLTLNSSLLLGFTRELAKLLKAGLPLYESLITIEEKYHKHKTHPLFLDLCDRLKEGSSFSSILKRYPTTFNKIYCCMIQAAEQSGNLAPTFEQLSQLIIRQQKLKKQLLSALTYPAFLATFCFCIICGLLFFIIPSLKDLFDGKPLHPITTLVLALSDWANHYVVTLGLLLCGAIGGIITLLKTVKGKFLFYEAILRFPLAKTLLLHAALIRLCRSLSMLLVSGVPLLEALNLSLGVIKNPLLEDCIAKVQIQVAQGAPLSKALQNFPVIPPLVLRMLSLAEETGNMGEAFLHLSEIYDEEMEKHLNQLTTFLQPALLITLGAIVGLVVLSILLPLTDMSSFTAT